MRNYDKSHLQWLIQSFSAGIQKYNFLKSRKVVVWVLGDAEYQSNVEFLLNSFNV